MKLNWKKEKCLKCADIGYILPLAPSWVYYSLKNTGGSAGGALGLHTMFHTHALVQARHIWNVWNVWVIGIATHRHSFKELALQEAFSMAFNYIQRVVHLAELISRSALPCCHDIYTRSCHNTAMKMIKDPTHNRNCLFSLLKSGRHEILQSNVYDWTP